MLGSETVEAFVNNIPAFITNGLEVAASMFPALGFALLLQMTFSMKLSPYFFLGFVIAIYFGVDITGVAIIGAIIAVILYQLDKSDEEEVSL